MFEAGGGIGRPTRVHGRRLNHRAARRAIDVRDKRVEPGDARRKDGIDRVDDGIEVDGARQVIERGVQTGVVVDERVNLGVGPGACQLGVERGEDDFCPAGATSENR